MIVAPFIKRMLILTAMIFYGLLSICYGLETDTHRTINEYIAQNGFNGFSLDSYLIGQLGIKNGVQEIIVSKKIFKWLGEGGIKEDIPYWYMPYLRSVNHFHNPLTDRGFSGIWGSGFLTGASSIQWSQEPIGMQSPGGNYSWYDVRAYFYNALTKTDKTSRDNNYADVFRGLGQLMHLVEDLSVPEHTRDDGHYIFYNYEKWALQNINSSTITNYPPIYFNRFGIGNPNPLAQIPIANLFDTNQYNYNGSNPAITLQNNIGLSEYTNANFFSSGTIFDANFPYPASSSVVENEETDPSGKTRIYLKKIRDGETINHLAVGKWFYKYIPSAIKSLGLKLDDAVYADYAQKLIPRAVGYSAGLLNYFFRGEIDMIPDEARGSGYVIENKTDEDMNGTFELWYDNDKDERKLLKSWALSLGKKSLGNNKSSNIYFTLPLDAKEFCKYILVFKGQLGQEQNAVIGKVINPEECFLGAAAKLSPGVTIFLTGIAPIYKDIYPLLNSQGKYPFIVRFAEGNPFIFGILSDTRQVWGQDFYYTVDLFEVDKKTLSINYLGEVLRILNRRTLYIRYFWGYQNYWHYPLEAQDLFISNDGKTVKIIGAYKEFIENVIIGSCGGYSKFDTGYFINEQKYHLGMNPDGNDSSRGSHGIRVYALNPEEIYLEYSYTRPLSCSGSSLWNIIWKYEYGSEIKIGANVIYSANEILTGDTSPSVEGYPYQFVPWSNFILKRDRGYSLSLTKYSDTPGVIDVASYSSEKGFFCEKKDIKWQQSWTSTPSELLASTGERVSINKLSNYYSTALIGFSPYFKECGSGARSGFSIRGSDFNNTDITLWRNWREEE